MRGARYAHGGGGEGGGRGNLCVAKTPPLQSGVCGVDIAGSAAPTIICAHMGINGNGEWEGNAAALRPPRTGRIGFKPPYSKRDRGERPGEGQSFIGGIFLRVERF